MEVKGTYFTNTNLMKLVAGRTGQEYNEIQEPRRKNVLIDYERLQRLVGAKFYDQLMSSPKGWVEEYLGDEAKERQDEETASIAVGSRFFLENVKALLGFRAKGKDVRQGGGSGYRLRENLALYNALFRVGKDHVDPENTYIWDLKTE